MKLKRTMSALMTLVCLLTTTPVNTVLAAETTTASNNTASTTTTTKPSNAEQLLANEVQGNDENKVVAKLENPEQAVVDTFSSNQKDSYMILANKYMTHTELQAMEWNLILSQFAVPYRENIQDVWNHTSWKDMREKGLTVDDNPYITTIQDNLRALNFDDVVKAIDLGIDITGATDATITTKMNEIAEVMMEDNNVSYSMVYNGDSYAYVSDLFSAETSTLTIKDKIAVTGDAANKTELWDALQSMQDNYLVESKTKEQLATDVVSGSQIFDIEMPVWINTDATLMYNAIYVANAIRIGGYGNFDNFINSVKNSQVYMDRWGNLCAYIKLEGEYRYVIVYPAYSNPVFTSTEIGSGDFAGYVYDNFDKSDFWRKIGSLDGYTNAGGVIGDGIKNLTTDGKNGSWGSVTAFGINPTKVAKNYSQMKTYISDNIDNLDKNDFLGTEGAKTVQTELAKTSGKKYIGGTYSRVRSGYSQSRDLIPIVEVDTTTNMVFNKAILSAYTRDSYTKVNSSGSIGGTSNYYDNNWYGCLNDSSTTYSAFSLSSQYNKNNKEALFSNSIVFDKYYTNMIVAGATHGNDINGVYALEGNTKYALQESTVAIAVSDWTYSTTGTKHYESRGFTNPYIFKSTTSGLTVKDTTTTAKNVVTLYPWMQLHTYRKGLYSDSPTLQATKTKSWVDGGINTVIEDRYVSRSWNFENTITTKEDHYRSGNAGGTDTQIPIEIFWNAMYTDSDKFKTYVVFNYTSEVVPSNSVIYGMGHRLTKKNQGSMYYVACYMDSSLGKDSSMGRIYMSIPLFDATIDTGEAWSIWTDPKDDGFVDSTQDAPRTRPMPTTNKDGGIAELEESMFFEPVELENGDKANALRFILNDQRVSDVLENYPLEDITLLSFVWRNYYIPQTPFRTKLNSVVPNGGSTEKPYKLEDDSSVTFAISEDSFLDANTALTPYNAIASTTSKVNNTLIWTNACSSEQESKLSPGVIGLGEGAVTGIGEIDSLGVSHTSVHRVSYNFGILLLAVNKNTQGDNLTNLIAGYDATKEFNTDDIMNKVAYFFEHPVVSLANIFLGFVQMIHNNVAVGNVGNIFDISWVIDLAIAKGFMQWYIAVSAAICCIMLVIRGLAYIFNKKQKLSGIVREWLFAICLSTVPVVILYCLSDGLKLMSTAMTRDVAGNLAAVEIEKEVTASENLNINFETVYTAYKEQFNGIEDNYEKLSLKVPLRWNASLNQMEYTTVTIKELYDSIEYSNVLASAKLEASMLEATAADGATVLNMYNGQDASVNHLYYSYTEFVPVNYEKYSSNLFYYFYDYIKYQYLAYWASQSEGSSAAFASAAKNFSLPDTANGELWSSYVGRMWNAEKNMLLKSYNGMYIMMHDKDYTYNKLYDSDGDAVYTGAYPTDMFGISYLFNMTDLSAVEKGYTGLPSLQYLRAAETDKQLSTWKTLVQDNYSKTMGTYSSTALEINKMNRMNRSYLVKDFYPLAYIMDNPAWQLIKSNNPAITRTPSSDKFKDYGFTPHYIEEEFEDTYNGLPTLSMLNPTNIGSLQTSAEGLKFSLLTGKRIPWRVYGSKSLLYAHTFTGDDYSKDTTDLEVLTMKFTEDAFEQIKDLTEYLQGDIRDSSLIFAAALVATMEFNKTFSGNFLVNSQLEPRTFTEESMDLDKFMRVTYARSMDDITKNNNVMYMIYEQEGGLVTAIIVAFTEIMIFVTMLARIAVLILLLLGCAYVCFCYAFHKFKERQSMVVGLITQLLQVVASQFVLIFVVTQSMTWMSNMNTMVTRLLVAILTLLCCFALTRWSLYMLFALIKDFKNFGGAIIQGSVNATMARMQSAFTDIRNNKQLKNLQASINHANVGEKAYAGGVGEDILRRRMHNAAKMLKTTRQIEKLNDATRDEIRDMRRSNKIKRNPKSNNAGVAPLPSSTTNTSRPVNRPAKPVAYTPKPAGGSTTSTSTTTNRTTYKPKPSTTTPSSTAANTTTNTTARPKEPVVDNATHIRQLEQDLRRARMDCQEYRTESFNALHTIDDIGDRQVELRTRLNSTVNGEEREMIMAKMEQNKTMYKKQQALAADYDKKFQAAESRVKDIEKQINNLKK